jgi:hypothetical protein
VFEGNPLSGVGRFEGNIEWIGFSYSNSAGSGLLDGKSAFVLVADGASITTTVSWESLDSTFNGVAQAFGQYSTTTTCTIDFLQCSFSGGGTAEVPAFQGTVRFEFEEYNGIRQPGSISIFGDGNSRIDFIAGTVTVELKIDSDGDGNFEEPSVMTTWEDLLAAG